MNRTTIGTIVLAAVTTGGLAVAALRTSESDVIVSSQNDEYGVGIYVQYDEYGVPTATVSGTRAPEPPHGRQVKTNKRPDSEEDRFDGQNKFYKRSLLQQLIPGEQILLDDTLPVEKRSFATGDEIQ